MRRAWTAATLDVSSNWYYPAAANLPGALDDLVQTWRKAPRPVTEMILSAEARAACADMARPVLAALESGRGFAIIDRVPLDRYSDDEAQVIYWLVGQALGQPFEQNVQGTLLYDVRDTGQSVEYGARFSVTNAETWYHTDNSFGNEVLDYVGLLCLKTAKSGGVNQVVSAYTIANELRDKHSDVLEILSQPFHIERRGGVRPGEGPTSFVPIMERTGPEVVVRYLRYWVEAGHKKVEQPLTPAQLRALDVLDSVAGRRDLVAEFSLKPGEMFFINNRWILHNRTAFEDHPEPERRRHYVRLWVRAGN